MSYLPHISIRRAVPAALVAGMLLSILPAVTLADAPPDAVLATEWDVLQEVNQVRDNHGLAPLRMADDVREVARDRSRSMKRLDYFDHVSPSGQDAGDLLGSRQIGYRLWGEVIGWTRYIDLKPGSSWMVDWWKRSPVHREHHAQPPVQLRRRRRRPGWQPDALDDRLRQPGRPHGAGGERPASQLVLRLRADRHLRADRRPRRRPGRSRGRGPDGGRLASHRPLVGSGPASSRPAPPACRASRCSIGCPARAGARSWSAPPQRKASFDLRPGHPRLPGPRPRPRRQHRRLEHGGRSCW